MTLNPEWLLDVSQHASADKVAAALRSATNLFRRGQCDVATDMLNHAGIVTVDPGVPAPYSPQSFKVDYDGSGANLDIFSNILTAAAGTSVVSSLYVYSPTAGLTVKVSGQWETTDGGFYRGAQTAFVTTGGWQEIAPPAFAVPAGKVGNVAYVLFTTPAGAAGSLWIAHPMIEQGQTVVAPYVATSGGVTATRPAALPDDEIAAIVARFKSNPQDPAR